MHAVPETEGKLFFLDRFNSAALFLCKPLGRFNPSEISPWQVGRPSSGDRRLSRLGKEGGKLLLGSIGWSAIRGFSRRVRRSGRRSPLLHLILKKKKRKKKLKLLYEHAYHCHQQVKEIPRFLLSFWKYLTRLPFAHLKFCSPLQSCP